MIKFEVTGIRDAVTIDVCSSDKVIDLKEKVRYCTLIPINKKKLIFNGQVLEDIYDVGNILIFEGESIKVHAGPQMVGC